MIIIHISYIITNITFLQSNYWLINYNRPKKKNQLNNTYLGKSKKIEGAKLGGCFMLVSYLIWHRKWWDQLYQSPEVAWKN